MARAKRFERLLYILWGLSQVTLFAVLVVYAKRGAVFARESAAGPIGTGMLLGMLGLAIAWLAGLPFRLLAPWMGLPGIQWHILQHDAERCGRPAGAGLPTGGRDLLEDAGFIRSLDLVVTVDTVTAHLAGALGAPVWTLLQAEADWRWMEGDRSPWYPSMRLFRQERDGAWEPVIERVGAELRSLASGRALPARPAASR